MTNMTLGAIYHYLGTQKETGGTATLHEAFFGRNPWHHEQQDIDFLIKWIPGSDYHGGLLDGW